MESGRLGPNISHQRCFGLRLKHLKSQERHWLHPGLTMADVQNKYESLHLQAEWRYDLRIRYLPKNFMESFTQDRTTLLYFYQQVSTPHPSTPTPP
uniref:FERM domain-containing protein n=1 Tax=Callorhinchus milii TaxID=7868 RepID=A0A4W3H1L4_CALMI